jgi:hypothetical protein
MEVSIMVRCKFRCHYKEECKDAKTGEVLSATIKMSPVYSETGENKEFWKYTPGGELNFYTVNPAAAAKIEQGKEYYIDICPADERLG